MRPKTLRPATPCRWTSKMSIWVWVAIGGVASAVATVVALAVARILGRITEDVSRPLDEVWSSAPLTRA